MLMQLVVNLLHGFLFNKYSFQSLKKNKTKFLQHVYTCLFKINYSPPLYGTDDPEDTHTLWAPFIIRVT